jgi:hypothetical protein
MHLEKETDLYDLHHPLRNLQILVLNLGGMQAWIRIEMVAVKVSEKAAEREILKRCHDF